MVKALNDHMNSIFLASWAIYFDESVSIWHSRWTCPGWICFNQNPHPFENDWHNSCAEFSSILFVVELIEDKFHPRQDGTLEFEALRGKTVGLLLFMMKSYFSTVRYVIIDSGFCVLKGFIQLKKKGIFPVLS